jgi:hypothetical protein
MGDQSIKKLLPLQDNTALKNNANRSLLYGTRLQAMIVLITRYNSEGRHMIFTNARCDR